MKVIIGSDHGGFQAKEEVKKILEELKIDYEDMGTNSLESTDYPIYAQLVAKQVLDEECIGILICGTGIGMSIAANKIQGIRAALCLDTYSAIKAREHNNANILCLRAREFDHSKYKEIVSLFLKTSFSNEERHVRRIHELE
jgi:ribose 5-phosphate isomerase B